MAYGGSGGRMTAARMVSTWYYDSHMWCGTWPVGGLQSTTPYFQQLEQTNWAKIYTIGW